MWDPNTLPCGLQMFSSQFITSLLILPMESLIGLCLCYGSLEGISLCHHSVWFYCLRWKGICWAPNSFSHQYCIFTPAVSSHSSRSLSIWNAYWCQEWGRNLAWIWHFWVLLVQHVFSLLLARTLSLFSMGHPLIVSQVAYPSSILDPMSDQSGNSIRLATVIGLEKGVSCRLDQSEVLPMMFFYHRD